MIKALIASNVLLTASYVASSEVNIEGCDQHTLYVLYSPDTDSTNALNLQIDVSPDGTNWYPISDYTNTSSTLAENGAWTIADDSAGTTDQMLTPLTFECAGEKLRVRYKETNAPGDYGNVTVTIFSRSNS